MTTPEDIRALRRDKYDDDPNADIAEDLKRLDTFGEPLAYVIGWIPFLGLRIYLDSRPLIPRPETEWWTEKLIAHLKEKFGDNEFSLLDLCAGSGAIGLGILSALPNVRVTFAELVPEHLALISKNIERNGLDATRAAIYESNLFNAVTGQKFDIIATNPPYIPEGRTLDRSVTKFEPRKALFAGFSGTSFIRRIAMKGGQHLNSRGELWIECDSEHAEDVAKLTERYGWRTKLHNDQYGRPRLLVSY